jgi:hypothetical protein
VMFSRNGNFRFNVILILLGTSIPIPPSKFTKALKNHEFCKKELPSIYLYMAFLCSFPAIGGLMNRIKDQVFREYGDHGAETIERYFAQIEYTALWCIRMMADEEQILAVIPEGVEDVVIVRQSGHELHQVKTRSESQGPWTLSEILPILCQQYHRRNAFTPSQCQYVFVSNGLAENKRTKKSSTTPAITLYQIKHLLEILHDGQEFNTSEAKAFSAIEQFLIPKIQETLREKHNEVNITYADVKEYITRTRIETNSLDLIGGDALEELERNLVQNGYDGPRYTTFQLENIYDRILLMVVRKIIKTKSPEERKITQEEVLQCKTSPLIVGNIDLDKVPGQTVLDKKAYLGGFDITEIPIFSRQRKLADWTWRRLDALGLRRDLDRLTIALLDLQGVCRNSVCRIQGVRTQPGPKILEQLRPKILPLAATIIPDQPDVDEQFCLGIIWNETELCSAWWQGFAENELTDNERKL